MKTGFLLHIISTDHKPLRPIIPGKKRAESASHAYYPKTFFTRNSNWAWKKRASLVNFFLMKTGFLLHIIYMTTNLSDQYFMVTECAKSAGHAYYPKMYFTRNHN